MTLIVAVKGTAKSEPSRTPKIKLQIRAEKMTVNGWRLTELPTTRGR